MSDRSCWAQVGREISCCLHSFILLFCMRSAVSLSSKSVPSTVFGEDTHWDENQSGGPQDNAISPLSFNFLPNSSQVLHLAPRELTTCPKKFCSWHAMELVSREPRPCQPRIQSPVEDPKQSKPSKAFLDPAALPALLLLDRRGARALDRRVSLSFDPLFSPPAFADARPETEARTYQC